MDYSALTLAGVTSKHIDAYLSSLQRTAASIGELAEEWITMDETEQLHFRLEFSRAFGLRRLLGAAYLDGQRSSVQVNALATLDRQLLGQAAALEIVYGSTLRQLVSDLFTWGTPLTEQTGTLHIETTPSALAELVAV
ncbi:MAG: hypothetical protein U0350_11225 [Caldilineaceae bacterium]